MHVDLLHPTRFLKSSEFKGKDVTHVISDVVLEEMEREDNSKETKGIVAFSDTPKLLILNRTNSDCLKAMFGPETDAWRGKRVTFFPMPMVNPFTKENITAIRLRGSPDIAAPVAVSIKLRKRKASTMTMQVTGNTAPTVPFEAQLAAMRERLRVTTTPDEMNKAWSSGMGSTVAKWPKADRDAFAAEFKAHKASLAAPTEEAAPIPA